jgi:hypothetical protein
LIDVADGNGWEIDHGIREIRRLHLHQFLKKKKNRNSKRKINRLNICPTFCFFSPYVCKYRDDDGRGNPFGPHAHNEEDSCAEAGQEESNPEEPAQKK